MSTRQIVVAQFYFYPDISAVSQLLGDLLCTLAEGGEYQITVYCATSAYSEVRNEEDERYRRLRIVRIRTAGTGKASFLARTIDYLGFYLSVFLRLAIGRRWDAVVSMSSPPLIAFPVALALLCRRIPMIYYIEDLFPEILFDMGYLKKPWLIRRLQGLNRLVMWRADRIITLSAPMSRRVLDGYPRTAGKIIEIPNWTREVAFMPGEPDAACAIVYSGNMGLAHDFSLLGPLVSALRGNAGVRWRFVGGGRRFEEIRAIFQAAGETRVELRGYTSRREHGRTLAEADLFLISQTRETVGDLLPSKLYSYLAAGRPMIFMGPRASEIGRIVTENDFGVVVEHPEDVDMACRYVEFLQRDPARAAALREAIDRYAGARFGLQLSAARFRQVLMETAGRTACAG